MRVLLYARMIIRETKDQPQRHFYHARSTPTSLLSCKGEGLILIVRIYELVPTVSGGKHDQAVLSPRCQRAHFSFRLTS